jgi:hypothetical protein
MNTTKTLLKGRVQTAITAVSIVLASVSVSALAQSAGRFHIGWSTLDGGGTSSGGSFAASGTLGHPDAEQLSGASFSMLGGFLSGAVFGGPRLRITRSGNSILLAWPNTSSNFVLQGTASLAGPVTAWGSISQPAVIVGNERQVTVPLGTGRTFFRLSKE